MSAPADIPPRMSRLLVRLVVGSFGLASAALMVAVYCFFLHGMSPDVAGVAAAAGGSVALGVRALLRV